MPELPEVETVARQLAPLLRGRTLCRLETFDPRLVVPGRRRVVGRVVRDVLREGKQVCLAFGPAAGGPAECRLLCHLRMTGRLIWITPGETSRGTGHVRARLRFAGGGCLLFVDPRRFGTLQVLSAATPPAAGGLDPPSPAFTVGTLGGLLRGSRQELKAWLLRQDRLVGLGNIYASEILFAARLSPRRRAGSLAPDEVRRLHAAVRSVLRRAIRHGGTTFSDFGDAHGRPGRFGRLLAVYGRAGRPCRRCGAPVERLVQQGRSTFLCPCCQDFHGHGTDVAASSADAPMRDSAMSARVRVGRGSHGAATGRAEAGR